MYGRVQRKPAERAEDLSGTWVQPPLPEAATLAARLARASQPAEGSRFRAVPPPVPGPTLARRWANKANAAALDTSNKGIRDKLLTLVPQMIDRADAGQMAADPPWRIDHQGPSHDPDGRDGYISMAAQGRGARNNAATYGSCHCPAEMPIAQKREGMAQAIRQQCVLIWHREPGEGASEPVKKTGGGRPDKGGGKPGKNNWVQGPDGNWGPPGVGAH